LLALKKVLALRDQFEELAVVVSHTAVKVWQHELPMVDLDDVLNDSLFRRYEPNDFFSPVASGSAGYDAMVIIPCSMGTLARIAHGTADDLMARAADVMLKERRKLVLVPREAPYNRIHIQNMLNLTDAGAVICPASPHFYHHPQSIEEACTTVVDRALRMAGVESGEKKWGNQ